MKKSKAITIGLLALSLASCKHHKDKERPNYVSTGGSGYHASHGPIIMWHNWDHSGNHWSSTPNTHFRSSKGSYHTSSKGSTYRNSGWAHSSKSSVSRGGWGHSSFSSHS
jgi:hypothetical protein